MASWEAADVETCANATHMLGKEALWKEVAGVHGGAAVRGLPSKSWLCGVSNSGEDGCSRPGDASTTSFDGRKPVPPRELRRTGTGDGLPSSSSRSTVWNSVAVCTDVPDSLRGTLRPLFSLLMLVFN